MGSLTDLSTPAQFQSELPGQFKSQKAAHFHRNIHYPICTEFGWFSTSDLT